MVKKIFLILILVSFAQIYFAHSVQVAYCGSCQGKLRLYVEHWHGSGFGNTSMSIEVTINGVVTQQGGSPVGNINSTLADLPNCSFPAVSFGACSQANTENWWAIYDFPNVPCGVDISIRVLSGSNFYTTDGCGMYPASTSVFQVPCPTPPVQLPDKEFCAGENTQLITFPNSNQPGVNYEWTNNNTNIGLDPSGNGDIAPFLATPSTVTETALIDVKQGCNATQFSITVHPQPEPNFSVTNNTNLNPTGAPLTTCLYDPIYFLDQSIISAGNIESVQWDFGEPNAISTETSPSHQYSSDGTFDVTLTTTSNQGCSQTVTNPVTVNPVPIARLLASPVCLYDSLQFEDSSSINFPDYIDQTIVDFGDGSAFGTSINPKHKYASEGVYNVSYVVVSNNGCIDNTAITTEVYAVPTAEYSFTTVCENVEPTSFTNQSFVSQGSILGWQWNFDEPINSVSTLPNPHHNYNEDGVYNVRLVVNTDKGCFDTIEKPVTVLAKPTAIFTSDITEACADACINFLDFSLSNATSIDTWEWDLAGGETSLVQNPSKCYQNTSNTEDSLFNIGLIVRNDLGCYDSIFIEDYIAAWHNPIADFTLDPELTNMYLSDIEFTNQSIGEDYYDWDFGDNQFAISENPTHHYADTGTYTIELAVETIHGCKDTTYNKVRIDPVVSLYIPNAFTPDGDGNNDTFFFKQYAIEEETVEFRIFDRWGTLIYYTDRFIPWDGTYKGELVKQDTYIYKVHCVDFFGIEHNERGHVNLIR